MKTQNSRLTLHQMQGDIQDVCKGKREKAESELLGPGAGPGGGVSSTEGSKGF